MMRFWLSRRRKPTAMAPSLAGSFAVHALLIGVAVGLTERDKDEWQPLPENSIARFLAPPNRAGSPGTREVIRYVTLGVPEGVTADAPQLEVVLAAGLSITVPPIQNPSSSRLLAKLDSVFMLVDVDSAAERYEWSAAPVFPPALLEQGVSGYVRAEWVVNERGVADTATFRILAATHPEFEKAVRDALPFMRFRPAKVGSRRVSQLVQQPFTFRAQVRSDTSPPAGPS